MLKKLLYLYNDGHNPFPKLGKGGLGYHLPQYKNKIHGGTLEVDVDINDDYKTVPTKYDGLDANFLVIDQGGTPVGMYKVLDDGNFKIDYFSEPLLSTQTQQPIAKSVVVDKINPNKKYIDDSNEFGEKFNYDFYASDTPEDYKVASVETNLRKYYDTMKFSNRELDEQIDNLIIRAPVLFDSTEYRKSNFKNQSAKQNALINMQTLLTALSEVPTDEHDEIIAKHKKAQAEQQEEDERELEESDDEEDIDTIITTMKTKPVEEQFTIVKNKYNEIYEYYKSRQSSPGKGYEKFLCEGASSILKRLFIKPSVDNNECVVLNFDDEKMIKDKDVRKWCPVDLFIAYPLQFNIMSAAICEAKDFIGINMTERSNPKSNYVAIQAEKLCGTFFDDGKRIGYGFDIIFAKQQSGDFYIKEIKHKNTSLTKQRNISDYFVSINDGTDTWICNLLKNKEFCSKYINQQLMKPIPGSGMSLFVVDPNKFPKNTQGKFDYDRVSGSDNLKRSIRIPKELFVKM